MANNPTAADSDTFVWFAELMIARQVGDRPRELEAKRLLRQLGVDVLVDSWVPQSRAAAQEAVA
tara:strand:+ start:269 stop:460 length:192 start_codon:yes stop_codon:yes gene_type:complete